MVTPLGQEVAMAGRLWWSGRGWHGHGTATGQRSGDARHQAVGVRGEEATASSSPASSVPHGWVPIASIATQEWPCAPEAKTESVQRRHRHIPASATPGSCVTAMHPPCPK